MTDDLKPAQGILMGFLATLVFWAIVVILWCML